MCQIYAIDIINLEYVRIVILFLFYKLEEQQSPPTLAGSKDTQCGASEFIIQSQLQ